MYCVTHHIIQLHEAHLAAKYNNNNNNNSLEEPIIAALPPASATVSTLVPATVSTTLVAPDAVVSVAPTTIVPSSAVVLATEQVHNTISVNFENPRDYHTLYDQERVYTFF